eukprot:234833-Prorocentrum_minimum.AAC.3
MLRPLGLADSCVSGFSRSYCEFTRVGHTWRQPRGLHTAIKPLFKPLYHWRIQFLSSNNRRRRKSVPRRERFIKFIKKRASQDENGSLSPYDATQPVEN